MNRIKSVKFQSWDSTPDDSPEAQFALQFVGYLAAGDFDAAHRALSAELRATLSPSKLREHYASIISYWECDVGVIRLMGVSNVLPPPRVPEVFGWIVPEPVSDVSERNFSVSIESDPEGLVEFIQGRIGPEDGRLVIRDILWGRP
jgi:hypothetical protein